LQADGPKVAYWAIAYLQHQIQQGLLVCN